MKNPNNEKLPNFFIEDQAHADKWFNECKERGLLKYFPFPRLHIDKGLTRAEAIFLEHCERKYKTVLKRIYDKKQQLINNAWKN